MRQQAAGECLSAVCHTVLTQMWHSPGNGPEARSGEPSARFRNQKGWTKAIIVRSKKTAIGWIFKQFLGRSILINQEKNTIFAPKFWYPCSDSGCLPAVSMNFPDRTSLSGSLLLRKHDRTDGLYVSFLSLWVGAGIPTVSASGESATEKLAPCTHIQSVCASTHGIPGKLCSFEEGNASTETVFSGLCLSGAV